MNWNELIKSASSFNPAIYIDALLPHKYRSFLRGAAGLGALASFIVSLSSIEPVFDGIALFLFSIFLVLVLFEAFYHSAKFSEVPLEYAVALILYDTEDIDISLGFLRSLPGRVLMFRLGISNQEIKSFLERERDKIADSSMKFEEGFVSLASYAAALFKADKSFKQFISTHAVSEAEFIGASEWIGREMERERQREQWWSKENLDAIPSLGTSLDFGSAYELSRYGASIEAGADLSLLDLKTAYRDKEIEQLQNILIQNEGANAVVVDDDESVVQDILLRLLKKIKLGTAPAILEHKSIIKLDWNALVSEKKNKTDLESEIFKLLRGAERAGNIIIYIPNLPVFMAGVKNSGVNLAGILEEFLRSRHLQIIAHSTKSDFHYFIEVNAALTRMFERVIPDPEGTESSMPAILEKAKVAERQFDIFFSYPGLLQVAESADRYITYGEMPSKAIDLLNEIAAWAKENKIFLVMKKDVTAFVSRKTGIASGLPDKEESERLARLEEILHTRIVGQTRAVSAVASAMRRARSGITNPKRPFASFLFMGPTGVGKTETSKALSESFFGGEDKIIRFDMSEYKEADALPKLIGSFSESRTGLLASKLRDTPYGVLLLDEFEKSSPDVLDLFLQVLDEGEFTDALGNKVNCRNLIIIATSNAGSEMIWKMAGQNEDLNTNKDKLIDFVVERRILKPELLNRFDGVVIFQPLEQGQLNQVANMMFAKLAARIKTEKQIEIKMAPSLLEYLVSAGGDQEFGARSVNRILQEKIEDFLARKILSGEAAAGSTIEIKREDLT